MPLYEYECQQCRRHTEKIQKFSDPEITDCPHCGGKLARVITAPAIAFKGGGWYADGYGNAKPKPAGDGAATQGEGSSAATAAPSEASGKSGSSSDSPGNAGSSAATPAATPAAPASTPAAPAKS